jgi:hypothetical protein
MKPYSPHPIHPGDQAAYNERKGATVWAGLDKNRSKKRKKELLKVSCRVVRNCAQGVLMLELARARTCSTRTET